MDQPFREHTKVVGDRTQAQVLARLLDHYDNVLLPFGENQRYDLVIEDGGKFLRVQCKTGSLSHGAVSFATCSTTYHHPANRGTRQYRHDYRGKADLFGVYCRETDGVYLVPVEAVGKRAASLRLEPTKNSQERFVRWARDYEVPKRVVRAPVWRPPFAAAAAALF